MDLSFLAPPELPERPSPPLDLVTIRFRVPGAGSPPGRSLPVFALRGFSGCCLVCAASRLSEGLLRSLGSRVSPSSGYVPEVSLVKSTPDRPGVYPAVGGPVSALSRAVSLAQEDRCLSVLPCSPVCVGTTGGDGYSHFAICLVCASPKLGCFAPKAKNPKNPKGNRRHGDYLKSLLGFHGLVEASGLLHHRRARNGTSYTSADNGGSGSGAIWYSPMHPWSPCFWV